MMVTLRVLALFFALLWATGSDAASRFWVGGTGTADLSDTTHWSATSNGAGGASVPGAADSVTLDGSSGGGTITINATFSWASLTMGAFTGTLDFATNNNSITLGFFSGSGTGARTLNMGSGTWTITATSGSVWDNTTVTNFTLNQGTSTILLSATAIGSRTLALATKTYNNITVTNAVRSNFWVQFTGAATIAGALVLTNVGGARFANAVTLTITGAITYNGTSAASPALFVADGNGIATLSVGSASSLDSLVVQNITKAGAGSISVANGYDAGGNTSVTITSPPSGGGRCIGC